jgi:hypothetical protein
MGDSDSDEYRAEDNRGGEYSSTTFNWVELLALRRGLNFGCWGTRVEPRRTGFAFNWARSGATAASLLREGQHIGVASQVSAGKVTLVFLHIGSNDFLRRRYEEIYNDELSDSALERKVADFIDDTMTAVDTVLDAGLVVVVMTEVLDPSLSPVISLEYPSTSGRQRVTDVVEAVNSGLSLMADKRGLVLVSSHEITKTLLERIDKNGMLRVANYAIDILNRGNGPTHLQLDDEAGHAGTVANALLANAWFVNPVNNSFGTAIVPFSDVEIAAFAGLNNGDPHQ